MAEPSRGHMIAEPTMKIDINGLTEAELIDLNNRIVELRRVAEPHGVNVIPLRDA